MVCNFTPSRCYINLAALQRNFRRLGEAAKLMPVIKSDAYGHGLLPVARALQTVGAKRFAVGGASEGMALRDAGFAQEILLLLGCVDDDDWQRALAGGLTPLVGSMADLDKAAALAQSSGKKLKIAVKCDTGMARLGFVQEEIPALIQKLENSANLVPALLVSHLACADMPDETDFTLAQVNIFNDFYAALRSRFPGILRSLGNSAATLGIAQAHMDILRPGYALYGGNPFADTPRAALGEDLEWVMSVATPVRQVRDLKPGQSISYGRIFTAQKPMKIAIVACGYATGFARNLSGKAAMLLHGRRAPQIGRVCMSMSMIDVSGIDNVRPGDLAWIMGGQGEDQAVTAQEIAAALGTIPYEVFCLMGSLNPRVYVEN